MSIGFCVVVAWWLAKDNAPWWLYVIAAVGMLIDEVREARREKKQA